MLFLSNRTGLKTDSVIGLIFTSFFGLGLFLISIYPTSVSIQTITMGNLLAISPEDTLQLVLIGGISAAVLLVLWKDLMATFFNEAHARIIGLPPDLLKLVFFTLLSASTVAAVQTVGAFLVVATLSSVGLILAIGLLMAPGAIAVLLTRCFGAMLITATAVCLVAMLSGIWLGFHLDSAPASTVVLILTSLFLCAFLRRVILTHLA